MDLSANSPLVDLFRRGEAPADVRLLAARGALGLRAHEQVALLMLLVEDGDLSIRTAANETIDRIPRDVLGAFLARDDVSEPTREFFRRRGVVPVAHAREGDEEPLTAGAAESIDEEHAQSPAGGPDDRPQAEAAGGTTGEAERLGAAQRLSRLSVAERVKRAMLGSREERFILIRDTNRLVAAAVLSSPKMTPPDIESIAKMANVSDEVLRIIGTSRAWIKQYGVAAALALNPKTPIAVSLPLVPRLVERDLKAVERDRNLPEPVRLAARRLMIRNDARRG